MSASSEETARRLYQEALVIDGLNVSNWDSPAVFESLHAGGVTAFNATVATLENYTQTLDNIAAWLGRFRTYRETVLQVKSVEDILRAKRENKVGVILGFPERHADRERPRTTGPVPCAGRADHSGDLSRAQSVGERLLRAPR